MFCGPRDCGLWLWLALALTCDLRLAVALPVPIAVHVSTTLWLMAVPVVVADSMQPVKMKRPEAYDNIRMNLYHILQLQSCQLNKSCWQQGFQGSIGFCCKVP